MRTDINNYIDTLLNANGKEVLESNCKTIEDYLRKEDPRKFFDEDEYEDGYLSSVQEDDVTFFISEHYDIRVATYYNVADADGWTREELIDADIPFSVEIGTNEDGSKSLFFNLTYNHEECCVHCKGEDVTEVSFAKGSSKEFNNADYDSVAEMIEDAYKAEFVYNQTDDTDIHTIADVVAWIDKAKAFGNTIFATDLESKYYSIKEYSGAGLDELKEALLNESNGFENKVIVAAPSTDMEETYEENELSDYCACVLRINSSKRNMEIAYYEL